MAAVGAPPGEEAGASPPPPSPLSRVGAGTTDTAAAWLSRRERRPPGGRARRTGGVGGEVAGGVAEPDADVAGSPSSGLVSGGVSPPLAAPTLQAGACVGGCVGRVGRLARRAPRPAPGRRGRSESGPISSVKFLFFYSALVVQGVCEVWCALLSAHQRRRGGRARTHTARCKGGAGRRVQRENEGVNVFLCCELAFFSLTDPLSRPRPNGRARHTHRHQGGHTPDKTHSTLTAGTSFVVPGK